MKKLIYSITICILAIISVIFAVMEITNNLTVWMQIADQIIYIIFVIDYLVRLVFSKNKKDFFIENIFDLISILPVNSAFRIFRTFKIFKLTKLAKFTRFAKFTRLLAVIGRLFNKAKKFLNTNGFKYILLLSITLVFIGGFLISYFENMNLLDGIWWAFVTATTVGYGDISPETNLGRIIACILMINGIGLIGSLTSTITSFFIHNKSDAVNNDKVYMVLTLYNELNDSEKEIFMSRI